VPVAAVAVVPVDDVVGQLERLGKLRAVGMLSDTELDASKSRVLVLTPSAQEVEMTHNGAAKNENIDEKKK
jgi:hypothetical protein